MGIPAAYFGTESDQIGNREDVSDLIFNIAPTETPFLTLAGTTTAHAVSHQWQTDTLATPANSAVDEGADAIDAKQVGTVLLGNFTQISTEVFIVTGTAEVVDKYGRDSEIAYHAAKSARELKVNVDWTCTGENLASTGASPRQSGTLETWINTNVEEDAGSGGGGFAGGVTVIRTVIATRAFTQALLDSVIQKCWTAGGKPSVILAGPVQKTKLSTFDGQGQTGANSTSRTDRASRTIFATADLYVSNFGELRVIPSRHIRQEDANVDHAVYCLDPEYMKVAYLRPWQQYDLAKVGDSIKRQMLVEWTLEMCNEVAHGAIYDCSV